MTDTHSSPISLPPAPDAVLILDPGAIDRMLRRLAHEIVERHPDLGRVALIGIPTRGVILAERLADLLKHYQGTRPATGVVDVSMHRDDLHKRKRLHAVQPTRLPQNLSDYTLILVDDVLFSGRTIRAAMDAISSFGRPARIQLAVLIDRGHRELPIRADYVGKNLPTSPEQRVYVRFSECDRVAEDGIWIGGAA